MANEIHGVKDYAFLYTESTWGTKPGSPTYVYCPVDSYGVRFRPQRRNSQPFTGLRQRKHGINYRGMPSGQMVAPLYGYQPPTIGVSLAQYLVDWGFGDDTAVALSSKGAEWAEGPNTANKRHHGLCVNQATLAGDEDSGRIVLTLDLMGVDEDGQDVVTSAQAIPSNMNRLVDFEFQDLAFQLDDGAGGSLATKGIRSFQWSVNNNLKYDYNGGRRPSVRAAGDRVEQFQCQFIKNSDVYDTFRRTSGDTRFVASLVLKGLHNGTGTALTNYTVLTINFNSLGFIDFEDNRDRNDFARVPIQFDVLKPDTSSNGTTRTWSEV